MVHEAEKRPDFQHYGNRGGDVVECESFCAGIASPATLLPQQKPPDEYNGV